MPCQFLIYGWGERKVGLWVTSEKNKIKCFIMTQNNPCFIMYVRTCVFRLGHRVLRSGWNVEGKYFFSFWSIFWITFFLSWKFFDDFWRPTTIPGDNFSKVFFDNSITLMIDFNQSKNTSRNNDNFHEEIDVGGNH